MKEGKQTYTVKGMTCGHCKAMVEKNLGKLEGVYSVTVDLATGITIIEGTPDAAAVKAVVEDLGFTLV